MSLLEYLSVLGPFEVAVTLVVLVGLVRALVLFGDLVIRVLMGERP
jgi:hypothetical protein